MSSLLPDSSKLNMYKFFLMNKKNLKDQLDQIPRDPIHSAMGSAANDSGNADGLGIQTEKYM